MTIKNLSEVNANLLFNLKENSTNSKELNGIECLDIST